MRTPTPTCAAIWSDTSIKPFPKTPPITNTPWRARTTCPLTSNRQFSAARFRYRWDAAGYSSAPGRESTFANIATTAARDGWWRLCTERGSRIEDRGSRIENRELKFTSKVIVLSSILDPRSSILDPRSSILDPPLLVFLPISTLRRSNASSSARNGRAGEWLFENQRQ